MYLGLSLLVKTCASLLLFPVTHNLHKAQLLTLQAFQLTVMYSSMYHLAPKRKRKII